MVLGKASIARLPSVNKHLRYFNECVTAINKRCTMHHLSALPGSVFPKMTPYIVKK